VQFRKSTDKLNLINYTNMKKFFKFYTEYNQFYVHDKEYIGNTGDADFWSEESFNGRLATSCDLLGVGTQCYGVVKGEVEILEKEVASIDLNSYDHIVEAGFEVRNGEIRVSDCPTGAIEVKIKVNNGRYRARIYSSNLGSVLETDLANDTDDDYYRIEIWPDENMELKVLKQYKEG
jgi:hypothetical protein